MINEKVIKELKKLNEQIIDNSLTQSIMFDYHDVIDLKKDPWVYKLSHNIYTSCLKQRQLLNELSSDKSN